VQHEIEIGRVVATKALPTPKLIDAVRLVSVIRPPI
jgi:hypothetical protein